MIKVGIIGFGTMGQIRYEELLKRKDVSIEMIYDPNTNNNLDLDKKFVDSYEEILTCKEINTVFICTPIFLNANITKQALLANKHVFCEKPPTLTSSEMDEIIHIESKSDKKLMYGFNHRHHGSIKKINRIVKSGEYGKILWMRGRYGKSVDSSFFKNWRSDINQAGSGILFDQGIHMLDIFLYLANDFDLAKSFITNSYWKLDIEDNAFVILKNSKTNVTASLHSTMTQWRHLFSLEVFLEKGSMILNGLKTTSGSYGNEILTISKNRSVAPKAEWTEEEKITYQKSDFWQSEIKYFCDSIINNSKIMNGNSLDALKIMKLIEKIYEDSKNE
tara:strand:- start:693 stop:1691 length:999 start_codon:yes stop_codon:yes gene_type:complete